MKRRQIDIIVVYKVDRLTRSLRDFAKLVEDFDEHGVSFISITQSFSTTTSMGRLTLNMLLSFAQFEREVTGERIRDKIAASKRKGIWVGGVVPLGYRVVERKLLVDEEEAKLVRFVFDRYLALGSLGALLEDLRLKGIVTRRRTLATKRTIGGVPFTRGPLAYLLRNRMYVGEINHGAESFPGEHRAIIPIETFEAVQLRLSAQAAASDYQQTKSEALLQGILYDDRGHRMTPSFAIKAGIRYRYYVSRATIEGRKDAARSIVRVAATDMERLVVQAISGLGKFETETQAVKERIERINIRPTTVSIALTPQAAEIAGCDAIFVDWVKPPFRVNREILPPADGKRDDPRAMSFDTRGRLLTAISKARVWANALVSGREADIETIAQKEGRGARSVSMLLSLAFLAPGLVKAIAENRMPRGIGLTRMTDLPSEWPMQWRALGLAEEAPGHAPG